MVAARIALQAFVEEYTPIATLTPRDEKNEVVTLSEGGDGRHAVRYLSADGIETAEGSPFSNMTLDEFYNLMEFIQVLCGLRIEIDVAREIELFHVAEVLDNDGPALNLTSS